MEMVGMLGVSVNSTGQGVALILPVPGGLLLVAEEAGGRR